MLSVFVPLTDNYLQYLQKTIKNIYQIKADQYVFFADRCKPVTLLNLNHLIKKFDREKKKTKVYVNTIMSTVFNFQLCYVKYMAFGLCSEENILFIDSDMLVDWKKINQDISKNDCFTGALFWERIDYPLDVGFEIRKKFLRKSQVNSRGLNLINKNAFLNTVNLKELQKIEIGFDTFLLKAIRKKHNVQFFKSKSIHLNPNNSKLRSEKIGRFYWAVLKKGFVHVLFSSLLGLRISMLRGYLYERYSS